MSARWIVRIGEWGTGYFLDTAPIEAETPEAAYRAWCEAHPYGGVEHISDFYVDAAGQVHNYGSPEYRAALPSAPDEAVR